MNKLLIEDEKHENAMSIAELENRMRGWLATDYSACLFRHGEEVVGYALINIKEQPLYLRQFFIARQHRRKGYGRAAFSALLQTLQTTSLDLDVLVWNESATAFWKSLGFAPRSLRMQYRG
jgi:predicted acetyltransferase